MIGNEQRFQTLERLLTFLLNERLTGAGVAQQFDFD